MSCQHLVLSQDGSPKIIPIVCPQKFIRKIHTGIDFQLWLSNPNDNSIDSQFSLFVETDLIILSIYFKVNDERIDGGRATFSSQVLRRRTITETNHSVDLTATILSIIWSNSQKSSQNVSMEVEEDQSRRNLQICLVNECGIPEIVPKLSPQFHLDVPADTHVIIGVRSWPNGLMRALLAEAVPGSSGKDKDSQNGQWFFHFQEIYFIICQRTFNDSSIFAQLPKFECLPLSKIWWLNVELALEDCLGLHPQSAENIGDKKNYLG